MERHQNAFYRAEASLTLASALRVGLWVDGEHTLAADGVAGWRWEYDDHGKVALETCLRIDGNPIEYR